MSLPVIDFHLKKYISTLPFYLIPNELLAARLHLCMSLLLGEYRWVGVRKREEVGLRWGYWNILIAYENHVIYIGGLCRGWIVIQIHRGKHW